MKLSFNKGQVASYEFEEWHSNLWICVKSIRICSLLKMVSSLMVSIRSHTNVQGKRYTCPSDKILGDLSRKHWCTLTMLMTVCIPHIVSFSSNSAKRFISIKLGNKKMWFNEERKLSGSTDLTWIFFFHFSLMFPTFSPAAGAYPVLVETSLVTGANIGTCARRMLVTAPSRREESTLLRWGFRCAHT